MQIEKFKINVSEAISLSIAIRYYLSQFAPATVNLVHPESCIGENKRMLNRLENIRLDMMINYDIDRMPRLNPR